MVANYHASERFSSLSFTGKPRTFHLRTRPEGEQFRHNNGDQDHDFRLFCAKVNKPNRVDDRAFYMNIAMNALAKEDYEFAGMSSDDIIMKRVVR